MFHNLTRQRRDADRIRSAIDNYPDGLCFAAPNGRPILVNRKMNDLSYSLTGHTITNSLSMWGTLSALAIEVHNTNSFLLKTGDEKTWSLKRENIQIRDDTVIQYTAADITELYHLRNQLQENNIRLSGLHERQRKLMQNIVQNNADKELLNAKMRIHDSFGRLLIMTKNSLSGKSGNPDTTNLLESWENIVSDMENAMITFSTQQSSPEKELVQIANMIGCEVQIQGNQPTEKKALLLLYASIREALTNAVRHANASRLVVTIQEDERKYYVTIEDDGKTETTEIQERGGLNSLRKRLEQNGGTMEILCEHGVVLKLTILKEKKDDECADR